MVLGDRIQLQRLSASGKKLTRYATITKVGYTYAIADNLWISKAGSRIRRIRIALPLVNNTEIKFSGEVWKVSALTTELPEVSTGIQTGIPFIDPIAQLHQELVGYPTLQYQYELELDLVRKRYSKKYQLKQTK